MLRLSWLISIGISLFGVLLIEHFFTITADDSGRANGNLGAVGLALVLPFILLSLSTFFVGFTEFLGVIILFDRFGNIKGWTLYEIALFYGMINMTFSIAEAMARGFDLFSRQVISGDFDRILLRPRSTALQILGVEFTVMRIGRISLGLFLILYSSCKLNVVFDFYNISLLLFSVIGSVCLFIGLFIIQGTMCFWSTESLEIMNMLTYGGVETMQYPLSIYGKWFKRFFSK